MTKSSQRADKAARAFCDTSYDVGEKKFVTPPERAVPGPAGTAVPSGSWRWVNLWATWCVPCVEELPLLGRWRDALRNDGVPLGIELWSIDEEEEELRAWLGRSQMPGHVRWLASAEDLGPTLETFGLDKNAAIPIHLLVDGADNIRCVRVGAVHEGDFGKVKALVGG